MSYEVSNLGRLRIKPEGTFGVDDTSGGTSISGYLDLPFTSGSFSHARSEQQNDPATSKQWKDARDFLLKGPKSCAPSWDGLLAGHAVDLVGNVTPPTAATWSLGLLLKTMMGGERVETPAAAVTEVQAGTSATVINVTAAHGGRFVAGGVIGCLVAGVYEAREVLAVSTDAVSVKVAFSGTPTTGTTVRGGVTYYLTDTTSGGTISAVYEGKESTHRFGYHGLTGGFSLRLENGGLVGYSASMRGANWTRFGSATLARATNTLFSPVAVMDSEMLVGVVGATTRNLVHCSSREWAPNIDYAAITSSAGVETIVGWERRHAPPAIGGTITPYWDGGGYDFLAAYEANTPLAMFQQLGTAPGSTILLSAPNVQLSLPAEGDADGLLSSPIAWMGGNDESISGGSSELALSAFRIHFL